MGTIDGTEWQDVTIDGEDVTEITVDGDTVWEAMTVYDSFDSGTLGNWSGETSDFNTTTNPRWWDSYALEVPTVGGVRMINYTGMSTADQPGYGDNFSFWYRSSGSHVGGGFFFCDSAVTNRFDSSKFYALEMRTTGQACELEYWDNGSRQWEVDLDDFDINQPSLNANTWYRVEVYIGSGDGPFSTGELGVIIRETDGTAYQKGSTTNMPRSSGYLGIRNPHDKPVHYYDYITDQVGADTI